MCTQQRTATRKARPTSSNRQGTQPSGKGARIPSLLPTKAFSINSIFTVVYRDTHVCYTREHSVEGGAGYQADERATHDFSNHAYTIKKNAEQRSKQSSCLSGQERNHKRRKRTKTKNLCFLRRCFFASSSVHMNNKTCTIVCRELGTSHTSYK